MLRFDCPSGTLRLTLLLTRSRKVLWTGFGLAILAHMCLTLIAASGEGERVVKPLTTQFVKRAPRLTKPLEKKKRPRPKRRLMQRKMVAVKAQQHRDAETAPFQPTKVLGGLARPRVSVGRATSFQSEVVEPQAMAEAVEGSREDKRVVDMSLELMDIEALDTGQYHALVIQDPGDRRSIRGFCHLAIAQIEGAYPQFPREATFDFRCIPGFMRLAARMNEYTDIKTDILGRFTLDDADLFKVPWLLINAWRSFQLSNSQLENLGAYLTHGGFAFADGRGHRLRPNGTYPGLKAMHSALVEALRRQGIQALLEKLPNSHPIYHCYFDFEGPPPGSDAADKWQYPDLVVIRRYLEGIEVDGRLMALLSRKTYTGAWSFFGPDNYINSGWEFMDPEGAFRFGINTIIFALTQEGSITRRLMDGIR